MTLLPTGVELRLAVPSDAEAGAAMHRACWREAYAAYADGQLLERALADAEGWTARWRHHLEVGGPRVLAVHDDTPVGWAQAGPTRDDAAAPTELYALYTRATWWGTGLGDALLDAALDLVAPAACSLWVLTDNARARGFYARRGFVPDGAVSHFEALGVDEVRLVRPDPGLRATEDTCWIPADFPPRGGAHPLR